MNIIKIELNISSLYLDLIDSLIGIIADKREGVIERIIEKFFLDKNNLDTITTLINYKIKKHKTPKEIEIEIIELMKVANRVSVDFMVKYLDIKKEEFLKIIPLIFSRNSLRLEGDNIYSIEKQS